MEGTIGLAPIPQGFTAQGCCLHYVPESCRRRTRTFIFEVQSFASYSIKRHGNKMEPSLGTAPRFIALRERGLAIKRRRQKWYPVRDLHSPSLLGRQECSAIRHQRGRLKLAAGVWYRANLSG